MTGSACRECWADSWIRGNGKCYYKFCGLAVMPWGLRPCHYMETMLAGLIAKCEEEKCPWQGRNDAYAAHAETDCWPKLLKRKDVIIAEQAVQIKRNEAIIAAHALDIKVARSHVCNTVGRVNNALAKPYEELAEHVPNEPVLNIDDVRLEG